MVNIQSATEKKFGRNDLFLTSSANNLKSVLRDFANSCRMHVTNETSALWALSSALCLQDCALPHLSAALVLLTVRHSVPCFPEHTQAQVLPSF